MLSVGLAGKPNSGKSTFFKAATLIDVAIANRWIALREGDIDKSIPFGIAAYSTVGAVRKIEWRPLE